MSFGFSASDFVTLGVFAFKLYDEFRKAPGACRAFANELLLFHRVLDKLGSDLQGDADFLQASDYAALQECADSCKRLIYVQIYGAACVPTTLQTDGTTSGTPSTLDNKILPRGAVGDDRFLRGWRQKWGERKFAARVPELQRAVSAHIQSLTAFNSLIVRYVRSRPSVAQLLIKGRSSSDQLRVFACQDRSEALQEQTQAYLKDTQDSIEKSQIRLEAASERIERTHANMERQLQGILASHQRRESPILSQSLDASSPEGRETWMNLGRLLRAEGITPAMIKQNRDVLVTAMKTTLQGDEPSNTPQSYHTACESFSSHNRTFTDPGSSRSFAQASLSLLGSAPPNGPTFTNEFLKRKSACSLEQDTNVRDGLESLLQGMDNYQRGDKPEESTSMMRLT